MIHPVKIYDGNGKLKRKVTADEVSRIFWERDSDHDFSVGNTLVHKHRKRSTPAANIEIVCGWCGETAMKKSPAARYCSKGCCSKAKNALISKKRREARVKIVKDCDRCGNQYNPVNASQRFCKNPCTLELVQKEQKIANRREKVCLVCSGEFVSTRGSVDKYCGPDCAYEAVRQRALKHYRITKTCKNG